MFKKGLKILAVLLIIAAVIFFGCAADYFDKSTNTVTLKTDNMAKNTEYDSIPFVADLHCDALLWDRDLLSRHNHGHVDVPRMQ